MDRCGTAPHARMGGWIDVDGRVGGGAAWELRTTTATPNTHMDVDRVP